MDNELRRELAQARVSDLRLAEAIRTLARTGYSTEGYATWANELPLKDGRSLELCHSPAGTFAKFSGSPGWGLFVQFRDSELDTFRDGPWVREVIEAASGAALAKEFQAGQDQAKARLQEARKFTPLGEENE